MLNESVIKVLKMVCGILPHVLTESRTSVQSAYEFVNGAHSLEW